MRDLLPALRGNKKLVFRRGAVKINFTIEEPIPEGATTALNLSVLRWTARLNQSVFDAMSRPVMSTHSRVNLSASVRYDVHFDTAP